MLKVFHLIGDVWLPMLCIMPVKKRPTGIKSIRTIKPMKRRKNVLYSYHAILKK